MMAYLAQHAEGMQIGPNILILPLLNPVHVAEESATLDVLTGGNYVLGVGLGYREGEFTAFNMSLKERAPRLEESVALIRRLWTEERLSFEGEYYRTENATIYDKPKTPVPIYVAGAGPQVAKYAGRMTDGFICTSGKNWDLYTKTLLPNVEEGLKLSSKPKPDYDRMIEMKVSFDTDAARALRAIRPGRRHLRRTDLRPG